MRLMKFVLGAAMLAMGSGAQASSQTLGYITGIVTVGTNTILVFNNGTRTTPPACSNATFPQRWAFDVTTAMGQATLSILMTAQVSHQTVDIYGTGTCSVQGDVETITNVVTNHVQ